MNYRILVMNVSMQWLPRDATLSIRAARGSGTLHIDPGATSVPLRC